MHSLKLFYCYERRDKRWFERLKTQLSTLQRELQITTFSKYEVLAGQELEKEVHTRLNAADIILLLISPDFIASDYCYSTEMELALSRHERGNACVIPILLRPVDWQHTPFSKLKLLPTNQKPITSWRNTDDAFLNVVMGIRQRLENELGKIPRTEQPKEKIAASQSEVARPEKLPIASLAPLKHFLYISDAKIEKNYQPQLDWPREASSSFQGRFHALNSILALLGKNHQIWRMSEERTFKGGDYIVGACAMRWGVVNWGMRVCFFFSASLSQPRILLLAGSVHHLWENRQPKEYSLQNDVCGASGSDLPGIMSAIEFAAEHATIRWSDGIGSTSDYLFALGFMQGKFIHQMKIKQLATAFPEQSVQFTALVLKTLQPPSQDELFQFFANGTFTKEDKNQIRHMLSNAPQILIGTPLYVMLGHE